MKIKCIFLCMFLGIISQATAQNVTWVDSVDSYARTKYMPAGKYHWTWQRASLLRAMTAQYEWAEGAEKVIYLDFVKACMDKVYNRARGHSPNNVASGLGMAFLARVTGEEKYRLAADKVYRHYMKTNRTENGGVTHKKRFRELWDDTVFMVGVFLQEMYKLTGDEKYIDELVL